MDQGRANRIAHIRQQIEAGTYATDARLRCCVEKLTASLTGRSTLHTLVDLEAAPHEHEPPAE